MGVGGLLGQWLDDGGMDYEAWLEFPWVKEADGAELLSSKNLHSSAEFLDPLLPFILRPADSSDSSWISIWD